MLVAHPQQHGVQLSFFIFQFAWLNFSHFAPFQTATKSDFCAAEQNRFPDKTMNWCLTKGRNVIYRISCIFQLLLTRPPENNFKLISETGASSSVFGAKGIQYSRPFPSLAELQAAGITRNNIMPKGTCVSLVHPRELRLCPLELVLLELDLFWSHLCFLL